MSQAARQLPPHKPITQAHIAKIVGCSQNTVALALRGSSRISAARREMVMGVADRLGYRPNVAARTLRHGRSGLVGLFTGALDDVRAIYVRRMIEGLYSTRYKPILGTDSEARQPWYDAPWIHTLQELQVEAMVSFAWHDMPRLPEWHRQIPVILSGFQPATHLPCDSVGMDRVAAAHMAVEHLLELGHRRIEYVATHHASMIPQGYMEAMAAAGLQPRITIRPSDQVKKVEFAQRYVRELRQRDDAPEAVFALSTPLAADIAKAALHAGLKVPADLALVGYDYMQYVDRLHVPITTVEQPIDELVSRTIAVTNERLEKPGSPPVRVVLPFKLNRRASS